MDTIGEKDFQQRVEASSTPVLISFYSQKCKPCAIMAPDIEELKEEYGGAVEFLRIEAAAEPELASRLSVVSTPTLILFVDGAPVLRMVGYVTKTDIRQKVDEQLKISAK